MRSPSTHRLTLAAAVALTSLTSNLRAVEVALQERFALPVSRADTAKPGFIWNFHQTAESQPNDLEWTEDQLAGLHGDNIADPSSAGIADAPAASPATSTDVIGFTVSSVINVDRAGGFNGNFVPDDQMPGAPGLSGGTDNSAAEILFWIELPAGATTFGCNSDDGFRFSFGGVAPRDRIGTVTAAEYSGTRTASDTVFSVVTTKAGLYPARVIWESATDGANIELYSIGAGGGLVLLNDTVNGGLRTFRTVTGTIPTYASFLVPANGAPAAPFDTPIRITLVGENVKNDDSLVMKVDGVTVPATKSQLNGTTDVRYQPTTFFAPKSQHTVQVSFNDGAPQTLQWSFTVQNYGLLAATMRVTPDTSKPGFQVRTFTNPANRSTDNQTTEDALNGLLKAPDGSPLPNLSNPNALGVALAAGKPESAAANANLAWEVPGVINLDATGSADANHGFFVPDDAMPGNPTTAGSWTGARADFITYATLKKGVVILGVNSDDGFRATGGPVQDALARVVLGEFNGTRASSNTRFRFVVAEDGTYPIRVTWVSGGDGADIELFSYAADGTKVLLNDPANPSAIRSYRAAVGNPIANPYVKAVIPADGSIEQSPAPTLTAILVDGMKRVSKDGMVMTVQGTNVVPTITQLDGVTTVTYTPPTDLPASTQIPVTLTFRDDISNPRTIAWSFTTSFITRDTLFIESEDFDFGHGQSVTDVAIGVTGPYNGGSFKGRGTSDDLFFDYYADSVVDQTYRPATFVAASRQGGAAGGDRGYFSVKDWWVVTGNDPGEWYNYTRTFPTNSGTGYYEVFMHSASDTGSIDWTLDLVTEGAGTASQTLSRLAVFKPGRPTRGLDAFEVFQGTDETNGGKPAIVSIPGGTQTLRLSLRSGGGDADYIALRPYKGLVNVVTPVLSVTWSDGKYIVTSDSGVPAGYKLQTASSPEGPWTDSNITLPYTAAPDANTSYIRVTKP